MNGLLVSIRYWWWRAHGFRGHLPECEHVRIAFVGTLGGSARAGTCAPGCPVVARRAIAARRGIERWTGHRGR